MPTYLYERLMGLIERYNKISLISEEVTIIKSKEGLRIIKSIVSMPDKLNARNSVDKVDPEVCEDKYLRPERIRLAKLIYRDTKILVERYAPKRMGELETVWLNEGYDSSVNENPDRLVGFCEDLLIEMDIDSPYPKYVIQSLEADGAAIGMKHIEEHEDDPVEKELEDMEGGLGD